MTEDDRAQAMKEAAQRKVPRVMGIDEIAALKPQSRIMLNDLQSHPLATRFNELFAALETLPPSGRQTSLLCELDTIRDEAERILNNDPPIAKPSPEADREQHLNDMMELSQRISEREAESYRAGYAEGKHDALKMARTWRGLSVGGVAILRGLFHNGPTWDGDLPSKGGRDELVESGLAVRTNGWQQLTLEGIEVAIFAGLDDEKQKLSAR